MNEFLNGVLGLDVLRFGDGDTSLGWAHPVPAWGWLLIVAAAASLAAWSYARLEGPRLSRVLLAGVRTLVLVLVVIAAAGPRLERERTEIERDRVLVLVDRSASLGVADTPGLTRDDQLRLLLAGSAETWARLDGDKDLEWLAFDRGVIPLEPGPEGRPASLPPAAGERTAIGTALDEAVRRSAGRPLSGVVVFSDGRSADAVSSEALGALLAERVPVHVVPVGSAEPAAEFAVISAEAPGVAFTQDTVPVTVRFDTQRIDPENAGRIEIVDDETGVTLESQPITAQDLAEGRATITTSAESTGEQRWTVRYVPDGPDLTAENNSASLTIRLVDDPIRVLYVDGSPRWEQRYLKSLLIREDSIDSSCLLLAVNRRFQQEGNTVLASMPQTAEDWAGIDVVVIGDIRPELLGRRTLEDIRTHVGDQAAGLLWLAGPTATPAGWNDTPLTDLLPLTPAGDAPDRQLSIWDRPVVIRPTPLAERAGLFTNTAEEPGGITDPDAGWSGLRWALRVTPESLKASAEPLALAEPVGGSGEPARPLLVSMRYGAGRVALVGTDEIWRWRYGRGEGPTQRFWLPLIRSLARPRLAEIGTAASLEITPAIAEVGARVGVRLTISDQSIAEIAPGEIRAALRRRTPGGLTDAAGEIRLTRDPGGPSGRTVYSGSTPAIRPGSFTVSVPGDVLAGQPLETRLEVISPDDELRNPQTDHAFLADLAGRTGGRVLDAAGLAELPSALPNRRVIMPLTPETVTLWDTPLTLALLLGLLTLEWVWRRLIRLS